MLRNFKQQSYMAVVWKMDSGEKQNQFGKKEMTQMVTVKSQKRDAEGLLGNLGIEILMYYPH